MRRERDPEQVFLQLCHALFIWMECAIVNIMYQGFFREAEYLISINENTKKMPLFVFRVVFGGRESKKKKRGWES